jgi:hypothetical protein
VTDNLAKIEEWARIICAYQAQYEALENVIGVDPDGPLAKAIGDVADAYTAAVSEQIGDEEEWLSWYWFDNDMGKKGLSAGKPGKHMPIKTVADLAKAIEINR